MPYKVSINKDDGIVYVNMFGDVTREEHLLAQKEAFDLCKQTGLQKLIVNLLELVIKKSYSTIGCFDFGKSIAEKAYSLNVRIAHIMPSQKESQDNVHFTSTVASNRGVYVGEFNTLEEARKWLLK